MLRKQFILCQALDFDDLLVRTVELLKIEGIGQRVREQFDYVLIDEYQDTNKAQFELTKLITPAAERLTVVGDASQAIYSFRGADFRNLELLKSYYENLTVIKLHRNYRSSQNILDAAYGIINNNTNHPILKLQTEAGRGLPIKFYEAIDERDEAVMVAERCQEESSQSSAILYRTNAQSRTFEEELLRRGISYRLVGGIRFYDRAEIKDLTAYLKVVANPVDSVSWGRIEKQGKRKKKIFEDWLTANEKKLITSSSEEVLQEILTVTGYLEQFDEKDELDRGRLENIREFLAVASEHHEVVEFLENIALIQADELAEQKSKLLVKITLMTVHSAKGLEFDLVFIVCLEEGLFPHSRSLLEKEEMEEERRLLYVAITRARHSL